MQTAWGCSKLPCQPQSSSTLPEHLLRAWRGPRRLGPVHCKRSLSFYHDTRSHPMEPYRLLEMTILISHRIVPEGRVGSPTPDTTGSFLLFIWLEWSFIIFRSDSWRHYLISLLLGVQISAVCWKQKCPAQRGDGEKGFSKFMNQWGTSQFGLVRLGRRGARSRWRWLADQMNLSWCIHQLISWRKQVVLCCRACYLARDNQF